MYSPPRPLIDQLKRHEGLRLKAYRCPAGKLTIGYGHNLEAQTVPGIGEGSTISEDQAERLLYADILLAGEGVLLRFPWAKRLDSARLSVLVNMAFNLGLGSLATFKRTLAAVNAWDWGRAADGMLASKWAGQVGHRSVELAEQMRTGEWGGV